MDRPIKNAVVVGALTGLVRRAPFSCAPVVLAWPDHPDRFFVVTWREQNETVTVDPISAEEWQHRVETDEGMLLTEPVPAIPGGEVWVLRKHFPDAQQHCEELQEMGALHYLENRGDCFVCLVAAQDRTHTSLLDRWATRHSDLAFRVASHVDWEPTYRHALCAWTLDPMDRTDCTAVFAAALLLTDRVAEFKDLVASEERLGKDADHLRDRAMHFRGTLLIAAKPLVWLSQPEHSALKE